MFPLLCAHAIRSILRRIRTPERGEERRIMKIQQLLNFEKKSKRQRMYKRSSECWSCEEGRARARSRAETEGRLMPGTDLQI